MAGPDTLLSMPSRLGPLLTRIVHQHADVLRRIVQVHGSPCHVVCPAALVHRANEMQRVFESTSVNGCIYYAMKANKSDAFLGAAAHAGLGADAASREEFIAALAAGMTGERIMVTGPHKGPVLHRLAIAHGATVAIDSIEELEAFTYESIRASFATTGRIVLRYKPQREANSRFGMDAQEIQLALQHLTESESRVTLVGFSVHLSDYSPSTRGLAGAELIELCLQARGLGLRPRLIDLGGGWPVSYVNKDDWRRFGSKAGPEHFHGGRCFSGFYPYHNPEAGAAALRACLECRPGGGKSLSELAQCHDLMVAIEPGRSLLDQAGASLFRIRNVRSTRSGYAIATVDGQSFCISEQWFGSEFLPDPILISEATRGNEPFAACVAGSSCLDADMLTWRKVHFEVKPAVGDLILYANTAGYQMDSNESEFHRTPIPKKVALWECDDGVMWCEDGRFDPLNVTTTKVSVARFAHDYSKNY